MVNKYKTSIRFSLKSAYFTESTINKGKNQLKQYSETHKQYQKV